MQELGRLILVLGLVLVLLGGLLLLSGRIPWLGKLPGDILIQRRNFTFYFPLATGILISLLLTLVFWLLGRR
jgi:hypothetical protein